jgi:hypothetical protein
MSKSLQIYYNAIFGAIGGLLGWLAVGSVSTGSWSIWLAYAFVGAGVGLAIGALTGAVEGAVIKRSAVRAILGAVTGAVAGLVSGVLGLLIGEGAFLAIGGGLIGRSLGWLLLGLFLGIGEGVVSRSQKRASYGALGGTLAGALGGLLYEGMTQAFIARGDTVQMIVGAIGLILIGASLGAIIPLTIFVVAGRGALLVRSGKRQGLELPIIDAVTIGSYDGCQLYLPGDPAIAAKHARIYRKGGQFFIEDLGTGGGTLVHGARIAPGAPVEVKMGAKVQVGGTVVELG